MISMPDDICRIGSERTTGANVVASLHRLAVVTFHLIEERERDVA
jgi:hypothetical protein